MTIQQIAGASLKQIKELIAPENYPRLTDTHTAFNPSQYLDPRTWLNFEVPQDVCATAYWYQTLPPPDLGPIEPYARRMADLNWKPPPDEGVLRAEHTLWSRRHAHQRGSSAHQAEHVADPGLY